MKLSIFSLAIAAYAAILSTINFYTQWRDKQTRISVSISTGIMGLAPGVASDALIFLSATNPGHKAVVVTGQGFILPDGQFMVFPYPTTNVTFPYKLEPEDKCAIWTDIKKMALQLRSLGFSGTVKLIGYYNDAVGRRYKSKPFKFDLNMWS